MLKVAEELPGSHHPAWKDQCAVSGAPAVRGSWGNNRKRGSIYSLKEEEENKVKILNLPPLISRLTFLRVLHNLSINLAYI